MFFFSFGFCNFFIYSFNMTWPHIFICSFHLEFFFLYVYNCHWVIDLYLFIKAGSLYHWFIWPSLPSPTSCFIYDHTVNSQNIISYNHTGNTVLFQLGSAATSYGGRPYSYSLASSWHHIYTLLQVNLSLLYVCIFIHTHETCFLPLQERLQRIPISNLIFQFEIDQGLMDCCELSKVSWNFNVHLYSVRNAFQNLLDIVVEINEFDGL